MKGKMSGNVLAALSFATFATGLFLVACSLNSPGRPWLWQSCAIAGVGAASTGYFLVKPKEA